MTRSTGPAISLPASTYTWARLPADLGSGSSTWRGSHSSSVTSTGPAGDRVESAPADAIGMLGFSAGRADDADLAERELLEQLGERDAQRAGEARERVDRGIDRPASTPDSVALLIPVARASSDSDRWRAIRRRRRFAASVSCIRIEARRLT